MATVIITTSKTFTEEEGKAFVKKVGETAVEAFRLPPTLRDVYIYSIPEYCHTEHDKIQMTFFIYTAPGKPVEYKRDMIKGMQGVLDEFFGEGKATAVVIIKEHPDENVGAGGNLRADMK